MDATISIDLSQIRHELKLSQENIERTVELLDEGNTVPFITRFRKDQTGGLDEEQVRAIQLRVEKLRALADRKQRILKWIDSQGKLTDELAQRVKKADTLKRLDDLYMPFKGKKQTLANIARQRGLETLANEIFAGDAAAADLDARVAEMVDPEKGLKDANDVLQGLRHILADRTIEDLALRDRLRSIVHKTGRLSSVRAERTRPENPAPSEEKQPEETQPEENASQVAVDGETVDGETAEQDNGSAEQASTEQASTEQASTVQTSTEQSTEAAQESTTAATADAQNTETQNTETQNTDAQNTEAQNTEAQNTDAAADDSTANDSAEEVSPTSAVAELPKSEPAESAADDHQALNAVEASESTDSAESESADGADSSTETTADTNAAAAEDAAPAEDAGTSEQAAPAAEKNESAKNEGAGKKDGQSKPSMTEIRRAQRERKRKKKEQAFKDYFSYSEAVSKLPPHRVLALNRGERSRILKVKFDADQAAVQAEAEKTIVEDHPHREFLVSCVKDALTRSIMPSLERELRRELTEKAEQHAIEVFARNLRKLLLQPPVPGRRILAIDPGFKSGCKIAAIDAFGKLLGHDVLYVVGSDDRKKRGREKIVAMVQQHDLNTIAIGNGAAYRETEQLVASIIGDELKGREIAYSIVNEAGSSFYSTSETGREELPNCDALLRSAVSIGRRLQDPLSELVKINPAHIGVGMYQHDVKYKHLQASLDAVVESCVNYVGVDVNTASPALLGYVSGLNQLTARRVYEHRLEHGPFKSREQLKGVAGLGDQTYTQAAGFLKIPGGENPLDATWIHPESYETAERVLENFNSSVKELACCVPAAVPPPEEENVAPATDTPAADAPATDRPATGTEATEQTTEATASCDLPSDSQAEAATAAEQSPADEQSPAAEEPAAESPATDTTVAETPEEPAEEPVEAAAESPAAESPAVESTAVESSASVEPVAAPQKSPIAELKIGPEDIARLAGELNVGQLLLQDIMQSLSRPGRDPREDLPQPVFRTGIVKLDDLEMGMELSGTVLNVVDFGAFVDIGLSDSGLVHISRLADKYVGDPHEVVSVGDIIRVWVVEVDKVRRRVSLTAIQPGTERKREPRASRRRPEKKGGGHKAEQGKGDKPKGRRPAGPKRPHRGGKGKPARGGSYTPRSKPKPVKPITDAMVEGSEPMRSFSDLLQFYEKKTDDTPDGKESDKK